MEARQKTTLLRRTVCRPGMGVGMPTPALTSLRPTMLPQRASPRLGRAALLLRVPGGFNKRRDR